MVLFVSVAIAGALMAIMLLSHGIQGAPFAIPVAIVGVVAPVEAAAFFGANSFASMIPVTVLFLVCLVVPLAFGRRVQAGGWSEEFLVRWRLCRFLLVGILAAAFYAQLHMFLRIGQSFDIKSLYDLNVAYSSEELPSFGLWGRVNRLAMPFGVLAAVCGALSDRGRTRVFYFVVALLYVVALTGPRRSLVFYQVVAYGFVLLLAAVRRGRIRPRLVVGAALALVVLEWFFGAIQIATKKSAYSSAITSGFREGSLYISGNLPYAQCVVASPVGAQRWSAFNIWDHYVSGNTSAGVKPFCRLNDGHLFNTSPGYVDVYLALGLVGVIVFGLVLGLVLRRASEANRPSAGLVALILTGITFLFRENVFGSLDFLQALLVYAALLGIVRMRQGRFQSEDEISVRRTRLDHGYK